MDPDSSNYIVKVIGDEFQTVNNDGEITSYGDYPNLSQLIRIGDHKEDIFESNPSLQPMGYAAVLDPIKSTASVPTASFNRSQTLPRVSADYIRKTYHMDLKSILVLVMMSWLQIKNIYLQFQKSEGCWCKC